ncbi:MAG: hypothetical protein JXB19_02395 [Bacteroidales bacterium]|nr:hypothetical protein [Bacteroidales bacterium]
MAADTGATLLIRQGTQLYFHKGANLFVYGNIIVDGARENPVVFRNDRPEEFYDAISGQWGTVYIDPTSTSNIINYAFIINAITGLQVGLPSGDYSPGLEIRNSVIQNVSFAGIYAFGANFCGPS